MLDRLSQLIKIKQLSASQFADEIGVQRSSVSHVLSGRNKPSLDFVTKVAIRFPDINTEWLLTGRGPMSTETARPDELDSQVSPQEDFMIDDKVDIEGNTPLVKDTIAEVPPIKTKTGRDKSRAGLASIEKIVIFYSNGSFSEYSPNE